MTELTNNIDNQLFYLQNSYKSIETMIENLECQLERDPQNTGLIKKINNRKEMLEDLTEEINDRKVELNLI
jgi:hypothetical protein